MHRRNLANLYMTDSSFEGILGFFLEIVEQSGYVGIFFSTILEGTFLPLPLEEAIIPFAGALVTQGQFSLWAITLVGGLGTTVGASCVYALSRYLGVPFLLKYGKYIFIRHKDIEQGQAIFSRYGSGLFILFSRLIPGVRGLIPIAAGIAKVNFWKFASLTFVGSSIYIFILAFVGYRLGDNWHRVEESWGEYSSYIGLALVLVIFALIIYYIRKSHRQTIWNKIMNRIKKILSWLGIGK